MEEKTGVFLAFDIGTSSLRTAVFDSTAQLLEGTQSRKSYRLLTDNEGRAELDPADMLAAAIECTQQTLVNCSSLYPGRKIVAVGASSLWHSLLGLDTTGEPLTRVITWADSRGAHETAKLREQLDARATHQRTGCMLHASFWPGKLLALGADRTLCERVAFWVSPAEYIYREIAGINVCAPGMASATGLYNAQTQTWDSQMREICDVAAEQLPRLDPGPQRPDHTRLVQHGLEDLTDARWYAAIGDGAASNLGSGGDRPGVAAINLGTSGAVRLMESGENLDAPYGLFGYRLDESRYLVGGAVSNLASLLQWCWRELEIPDSYDAFEDLLESRPAPEHGLSVLPFWLNERAPRWRDDLTGGIFGLTQSTTSLDIAQATLESAYHRLALIVDALSKTREVKRIIVSGGLATRRSAMQRLCNVLGEPIEVCSVSDASIRGAVAYVLSREGVVIDEPDVAFSLTPDRQLKAEFASQRDRQVEFERKLFGIEFE